MNQDLLKRRLFEQKEYVDKFLNKDLIKREQFEKFKSNLNISLAKAIIGPRRAGKTTFGLQLFQNLKFYYINFDDEVLSKLKDVDLGVLLELLNENFGSTKNIFLDEIQNIKGWEIFVNRLLRLEYNVILSGSNSNLLSSELSTHLGGRVISIEILPFSFKEFFKLNNYELDFNTDEKIGLVKNNLKKYILKGGYPEINTIISADMADSYFGELLNTTIVKDILKRYNLKYVSEIFSIFNILLNNFSSRISLKKISDDLGLSIHTIKKYILYLKEAYAIIATKKFSYKPREIESSFSKYYPIDSGFLKLENDFGKLMELIVALELKRRKIKNYYYMADNKYEVDFLEVEKNKVLKVIQVVYDANILPARELKTGILTCKELKCDFLDIITWNYSFKEKKNSVKIRYIPLYEFLLRTNII